MDHDRLRIEALSRRRRDAQLRKRVTKKPRRSRVEAYLSDKMNLALIDPFQLSQDYPECLTNELRK